ncbi:MAG: TniQ family protein [Chloroflexi bacterium]|nr:TniQ family protein [Chloroflexota bacterium]
MPESRVWFFEVLPQRPPPYPGECLSGYLLRLAEANGALRFWSLARDLFPRWTMDEQVLLLRWEYPLDEWGRLPLRTQRTPDQLRALSVAPWLEKFRPPISLTRPGRLSPGHWLRGAVRPRLQVCPQCLQEEPYVRLLWRLMPVEICLAHGCWLQGECSQCGHTLRVVSPGMRYLHCADCGLDLRQLPVESAPAELRAPQARRQADLAFLLNPGTRLVPPSTEATDAPSPVLSQAIGLGFHYLGEQQGLSLMEVARQLKVSKEMVWAMEGGKETPLALYWSYLEILALSWSDFAAVQLPVEFIESLREIPHLALRVCPMPDCPNHQGPSAGVTLRGDVPDRRRARFRCSGCGCRFTRTYEGEWVKPHRKSPSLLTPSPEVHKPHEELVRLMELGRQGLSDKRIARVLGWSTNTVRRYWKVLGVEREIYQAQVARRGRQEQERKETLEARVAERLPALLASAEEISIEEVSRALDCSEDFLRNYPGLRKDIRERVQAHNRLVDDDQEEALKAQCQSIVTDLKRWGKPLTILGVAVRAGYSPGVLARTRPRVYAAVRQAVGEYNAQLKLERRQKECAQINAAAARLVVRGIRLTQLGILKEAGVHTNRKEADPAVRELIDRWIGDPTQRW